MSDTQRSSLDGATIVLGVSGGIAAYKACELASRLTQAGAVVPVVMTAAATRFVAPLTFQALTHQPVHTSLWATPDNDSSGVYAAMPHVGLADTADLIVIAPASADIIARLAHGLADDLLTTLVLATHAPVLVAPAMNPTMLAHPATRDNLARLAELGYHIVTPESGRMACEHVGSGRLPTTEVLLAYLSEVLGAARAPAQLRSLSSKQVLVTAGPTREAIDPVRYITNRSSGKMGYSVAATAAARGAEVVLISGPTGLATPPGVQRVDVTTTQEMLDAALRYASTSDIIIAAAAPADYKPARVAPHKIKKRSAAALTLELTHNPDILATLHAHKRPEQFTVGFAAETRDVVAEARRKLEPKGLDAIVANDVTQGDAGFDVDTNRVVWITADATESWPLLSKTEVANRILDKIEAAVAPGAVEQERRAS